MRTIKPVMERKNIAAVLEAAKTGASIYKVAKIAGVRYNVAKYLVEKLEAADLLETTGTVNFEGMLKSKDKNIIVEAFQKSKTVLQGELMAKTGKSKLPSDMLEDLRTMETAGVVKVSVQRGKKVFELV